jgi:RNA recognition motif-containing protein
MSDFTSEVHLATSLTEHKHTLLMSFTVFLGNLPTWVTKDDIKSWLASENLVSDDVKVIRNPETQESKGFAFIESPNQEEMNSIIRRFDRAPLEDRLLRANPAQPPKSGKSAGKGAPGMDRSKRPATAGSIGAAPNNQARRGAPNAGRPTRTGQTRQSAFAEELAKAL